MRTRLRQKRLLPGLLCSLLLLSLCAANIQNSSACSWDYMIWMIRNKSADPLYRFVQHGKAGYIDRTGIVVIPPQFNAYGNYAGEFHDGLLQVSIFDGDYVDTSGKKVIEGLYHGGTFSEGLAVVRRGLLWGYIDYSGKLVIPAQYHYAESFSEGLAVVADWNEKKKWYEDFYYINKQGRQALAEGFAAASHFFKGLAHVRLKTDKNGSNVGDGQASFAYIDASGKRVFAYRGER